MSDERTLIDALHLTEAETKTIKAYVELAVAAARQDERALVLKELKAEAAAREMTNSIDAARIEDAIDRLTPRKGTP